MSNSELEKFDENIIRDRIYSIRGYQVMLDRDLAELYGVETRTLNQAVKRNIERFPDSFCFQLTEREKSEVVANCDHLLKLKYSYTLPYAFSEHRVVMLSSILRSAIAVKINILIVKAFVDMRKLNNPDFKPIEFERFKMESGTNYFVLSPQKWIESTNAKGIISKSGR